MRRYDPTPDTVAARELKQLQDRYNDLLEKQTIGMSLDEYLDHQRKLNELGWKLKARKQKPVSGMGHTDTITIAQ